GISMFRHRHGPRSKYLPCTAPTRERWRAFYNSSFWAPRRQLRRGPRGRLRQAVWEGLVWEEPVARAPSRRPWHLFRRRRQAAGAFPVPSLLWAASHLRVPRSYPSASPWMHARTVLLLLAIETIST